MRYQLKPMNEKESIFIIIDTKPKAQWDNEIATVYNIKNSKVKRVELVHKGLNLRDELGKKPEKKTKAELVEIIKKYL